jgi:hypothetical protein
MAVAWVKKLGTEYVEDRTFVRNFFRGFAQELGKNELNPSDVDFSEIQRYVTDEKNRKLAMSKEERKRAAQERKAIREANKEKHGYACADGLKVEIGNYMVEPSSIFMGRGKHPLRGRWKQGVGEREDVKAAIDYLFSALGFRTRLLLFWDIPLEPGQDFQLLSVTDEFEGWWPLLHLWNFMTLDI